ncbi:MAG TPA: tRNA (N6-isopentenyl adenosine(37)-C2)-methylthiotransferase MiaB [candidate division WOR-3 bacterium]|uniref:tRNA-2-methylthio-N(6)-dimethylallyladenosine synthase n=1 Tax=candidate division WOR-3 bacterium TaxID=2052148 RepID=A0A7C0XA55_UNCW3|nr:tRNA (N6-isopentenyl adenosine(37)-C2)-methylthiotransferase MiaB [candidate division WOR-3 bacterium]
MKFFVRTFGCQMNVYDSELISELLLKEGLKESPSPEEADVILVNTCTVRQKAEERGHEYARFWKRRGKKVVILGCLAQQDKEKLLDVADLVIGTRSYTLLPGTIKELLKKGEKAVLTEDRGLIDLTEVSLKRSPRLSSFSEFVTIMRGCDNFCSYCIVPYVRGREMSRPPEMILSEIKNLESRGIIEVTLLGQNVNSYFYGGTDFAELLEMIDKNTSLYRLRFTTSHPRDMSYKTIKTIMNSKRITHWFHLPLQAGSTKVLRLMRRGYTKEEYLDLVGTIRGLDPDASVTTDIMVGFPGEEEEDFLETLDVVEKAGFDHAYTFIFTKRPRTAAFYMKETLSPREKGKRLRRLIESVNKTVWQRRQRMLGRTYELLIEGPSRKDKNLSRGRTDGNITVVVTKRLEPGTRVLAKIRDIKGLTPIADVVKNLN